MQHVCMAKPWHDKEVKVECCRTSTVLSPQIPIPFDPVADFNGSRLIGSSARALSYAGSKSYAKVQRANRLVRRILYLPLGNLIIVLVAWGSVLGAQAPKTEP